MSAGPRAARSGIALIAALLLLAVLAALLAARGAVQTLHVAALAAERRALHAAADADTALAWQLARPLMGEPAEPATPLDEPLPAPLQGWARRRADPRGVRIVVEVVREGAFARREALLSPASGSAP